MKNSIKLFSYKMTDDVGFAPNPFHGFMTLACCKPGIRETKDAGNWIAGFTSKCLNGDTVGEERLIFLMKVNCKITYDEYWNNLKYKVKKPVLKSRDKKFRFGDNIYQPDLRSPDGYVQIQNCCHTTIQKKEEDLKSKQLLISRDFYYFGGKPLKLNSSIRPNVPIRSTCYGYLTEYHESKHPFINFIEQNYKKGIINYPTSWYDSFNSSCK